MATRSPNVLYIFADQWRARSLGYAGDPNARTPFLDQFAAQSVNMRQAVSGIPVCGPARATLISGQRPLTHGVFVNDVPLPLSCRSIAERFQAGGYDTGYIGKWHIDGHGRQSYIPPERHRGFDHWQVCECSHQYNDSPYFEGSSATKKIWPGYDADSQTTATLDYIGSRKPSDAPFFLMLSWGPPHDPYDTAPEEFRAMFAPERIVLPSNVPAEMADWARNALAGYYAHGAALDRQFGRIMQCLAASGLLSNTIVVFTSDHGDMLGSQGVVKKQWPWEESIRIPFLLRWPEGLGAEGRVCDALLDVLDHQPTLLDLCGLPLDAELEGRSFAGALRGESELPLEDCVLLTCPHPFGEVSRQRGGREYRGIRTYTHTYVETLEGPWLLYNNLEDPEQLCNLVKNSQHQSLVGLFHDRLHAALLATDDDFEQGETYCERWGYKLDATGTVPFTK